MVRVLGHDRYLVSSSVYKTCIKLSFWGLSALECQHNFFVLFLELLQYLICPTSEEVSRTFLGTDSMYLSILISQYGVRCRNLTMVRWVYEITNLLSYQF